MGSRPQTIGPYALEKRLGAGGMGEVYQAYDARLDRWVAIKLIRPESSEDSTARERFRREARAAAGLSHPAIVQIHDIVETGEGDAIVMELVEGESLASRIRRGPLPIQEAVRLGREIAEGLAAAHARGIVHRDLKTDNVMITADGRAKILDFGLAKRLEGEASLTGDHRVVGTLRSMSPEQARGLPLDHRSDLFSFGVLLYETLAGLSPFDGGSALETLTRICSFRQDSLRKAVPSIPEELSILVDHLLEKEPDWRPASARSVAADLGGLLAGLPAGPPEPGESTVLDAALPGLPPTPWRSEPAIPASLSPAPARKGAWPRRLLFAGLGLLVLAAVLLLVLRSRLLSAEPLSVAVPRPEITGREGGGEEVELMASGLQNALFQGLLAFEGVSPVDPEQVKDVTGSAVDVARAVAAGEVLTSRLRCAAEVCRIELRRVRGEDGRLLWTQSFEAPLDRNDLTAEAAQAHLRQGYSGRGLREGAPRIEVRNEDYQEYLRVLRSFEANAAPLDDLVERLERVRSTSPRFVSALLLEAHVLQDRFRSRRSAADLERATSLLRQARGLAPADPRPVLSLFESHLLAEDLERAGETLRDFERLQPGSAELLARQARLLERRGEGVEALRLMTTAARRQPSWLHLFWAGRMAYRLGRIPEARGHLDHLLQRFPGHYLGRSKLAELELMSGSPERAAELYTDLVRRSPNFEEITNLGVTLFLLGRYPEAEERYRQAMKLAPDNPFAVLNLADTCSLLGRGPEAGELYTKVLTLIDRDPTASDNSQLLSVRAQALAHLGRSREAVAAIQAALRLAPDNAQIAYEASLVYTLLGDEASAFFNAGKALEQGYDPRWFSFPWFEPLRTSPEFRKLLDRGSAGRGETS